MSKQQAFLVTITDPGVNTQTINGLDELNERLGKGWSVTAVHPLTVGGGPGGPITVVFGCLVIAQGSAD